MTDDGKVVYLHRVRASRQASPEPVRREEENLPVDIRGHITFGRLLSGLSTVGLTMQIDPRSGRIVITDELAVK